jgi:hypothetical protein
LAVGGYEHYQNRQGSCIPNIFANTNNPELDLLHPYTIFFSQQESLRHVNLRKGVFSDSELIQFYRDLGWNAFADTAKEALRYLLACQLLETVQEESDEVKYAALPRATMLWTYLHENSLLVSLYRDDCFMTHGEGRAEVTSRLAWGEKQVCGFFDFVNFVNTREEALLNPMRAADLKRRRFKAAFGNRVLSHRLMEGVGHSMHRIFGNNIPEGVRRYSEDLSTKIRTVQQLVDPV